VNSFLPFWSCSDEFELQRMWATSPYFTNLRNLWTDYPTTTITATVKWYYLVQFAFWIQQIIVVNMERYRKDYWQMLIHHLITCTLLFTSYNFYMTRVGNVILCLMDVADIVLSVCVMLHSLENGKHELMLLQVCQSPQVSRLPSCVRYLFRCIYCRMVCLPSYHFPNDSVVCLERSACCHAAWLLLNNNKGEAATISGNPNWGLSPTLSSAERCHML
jgi:hypothetical protein